MISLTAVLVIFISFFAVIGGLRGWAKEMLVAFSTILALFLLDLFTRYTPLGQILAAAPLTTQFWAYSLFLAVFAMFGYAGPALSSSMRGRLKRETIQDIMLGAVIGAANGYLIIGTILYYLDQLGYPFDPLVIPPAEDTMVAAVINWLAPNWLTPPLLYFVVGLSFVVVIILFV